MITADEARTIVGPTLHEFLEFLDDQIREAARARQYSVTVTEMPYCMWADPTYTTNTYETRALVRLTQAGFVYQHDATTPGLVVSWDHPPEATEE